MDVVGTLEDERRVGRRRSLGTGARHHTMRTVIEMCS